MRGIHPVTLECLGTDDLGPTAQAAQEYWPLVVVARHASRTVLLHPTLDEAVASAQALLDLGSPRVDVARAALATAGPLLNVMFMPDTRDPFRHVATTGCVGVFRQSLRAALSPTARQGLLDCVQGRLRVGAASYDLDDPGTRVGYQASLTHLWRALGRFRTRLTLADSPDLPRAPPNTPVAPTDCVRLTAPCWA